MRYYATHITRSLLQAACDAAETLDNGAHTIRIEEATRNMIRPVWAVVVVGEDGPVMHTWHYTEAEAHIAETRINRMIAERERKEFAPGSAHQSRRLRDTLACSLSRLRN